MSDTPNPQPLPSVWVVHYGEYSGRGISAVFDNEAAAYACSSDVERHTVYTTEPETVVVYWYELDNHDETKMTRWRPSERSYDPNLDALVSVARDWTRIQSYDGDLTVERAWKIARDAIAHEKAREAGIA